MSASPASIGGSERSSTGAAPLALMLSGGGARAAYQVGVLATIAEMVPDLDLPILTGVSAGAINTAYLAAHGGTLKQAVGGLQEQWAGLTADQVYCVRAPGVLRGLRRWVWRHVFRGSNEQASIRGLMDLRPLRTFLSGCIDFDNIETKVRSGRLRAVALSTTSYASGSTVTFVHAAPEIATWERAQRIAVRARIEIDHVMAASAIPIAFPAVRLEDGFYGDGSVRQAAPLAPAIHLGAGRVLAIAMRAQRPSRRPVRPVSEYPSAAEVIGLLFHTVFLDALDADVERLERINALLRTLSPGCVVPNQLRVVDLLVLRPSRDLGALAAGRSGSLPARVRWVVRAMGGGREGAADFLSYLLFEPHYTDLLVELGHADARAQWDRIEPFLAGDSKAAAYPGRR